MKKSSIGTAAMGAALLALACLAAAPALAQEAILRPGGNGARAPAAAGPAQPRQPPSRGVGDGTPTATASSSLLPLNWPQYITVNPGQKIAVLGNNTTGTVVNIVELVQ